MTRYLLQRPIAVFMVTLALAVFSVLALLQLPVSLLPALDVPALHISVRAPDYDAPAVDKNLLQPIRQRLLTLRGLEHLESTATSGSGSLSLRFAHGTRMDLVYVEVNERIDRLAGQWPAHLERPRVVRLSTADIPVARLQISSRPGSDPLALSELTEKVLRRRIEQLPGIATVQVTGTRHSEIAIVPDLDKMAAYRVSLTNLVNTVSQSNIEWGAVSVKDGQYRYHVKLATHYDTPARLLQLPLRTADGRALRLADIVQIEESLQQPAGLHLFNRQPGPAIIVRKQSQARMLAVMQQLRSTVAVLQQEFPQVDITLMRDQSQLLMAGIDNLRTALLFGGLFAIAVLFLFMSNVRLALIMAVSLPLSLLLSFLVFYLSGISINIISLSGLALGLGMLIDNAIIVLDNISAKVQDGLPLTEACVQGVAEVTAPLISSVLTTLAVFVPLVYLHGMAGALFYDQAVAVAAILGVSLLVSFALLPLLYYLLFRRHNPGEKPNRLFALVLTAYDRLFALAWRHKAATLLLIVGSSALIFWFTRTLPRQLLPPVEHREMVVQITWNEPLSLEENRQRITSLLQRCQAAVVHTESEIGQADNPEEARQSGRDHGAIYLKLQSASAYDSLRTALQRYLAATYPLATVVIEPAPNAFDQLFAVNEPPFKLKIRTSDSLLAASRIRQLTAASHLPLRSGIGFATEPSISLHINYDRLSYYGIDSRQLHETLARLFGPSIITRIERFGSSQPVVLQPQPDVLQKLAALYVHTTDGATYPLSYFVTPVYNEQFKFVTADDKGPYQALLLDSLPNQDVSLLYKLRQHLAAKGLLTDLTGAWFTTRQNLQQLAFVLAVAFLLLYFILAAQFESFVQPLIIVFTMPLGISGSLLLLYIGGYSLNIMSAIGIIIMLGIMINDAILKLDTLNRYVRQAGRSYTQSELYKVIHQAGVIRLRPILMTTLTTVLALLPVLLAGGLGAQLQHGLVLAVSGGLLVGTFTALFFIPLAYYLLLPGRYKKKP